MHANPIQRCTPHNSYQAQLKVQEKLVGHSMLICNAFDSVRFYANSDMSHLAARIPIRHLNSCCFHTLFCVNGRPANLSILSSELGPGFSVGHDTLRIHDPMSSVRKMLWSFLGES